MSAATKSRAVRERRWIAALGALLIAAATVWSVMPSAGSASPHGSALAQEGDTMTVQLQVSGAIEMAAFDATLQFDAAVISPTGVTAGDFLPEDGLLLPMDDSEAGRVVVGGYSPNGRTVTGDGHLVTLTFERHATRSPRLRLVAEESGVYDAAGRSIAPPARIVIAGLAPPRIYLPWSRR